MAEPFNAAEYLVHRHGVEGRGDHIAVEGSKQTLTYDGLGQLIKRVGAGYRALGLRHDDRIMMVMSDDVPMLAAIIGAFHAGVVAVPVSTMFNPDELGKILGDSGARALVCTEEFADTVATALDHATDVEHVIHVGDPGTLGDGAASVRAWDDFLGSESDTTPAEPTTDDHWALWLYTSGTTGQPKAAMHRHANIRHVCETYGQQVLGITPEDRTLSVAKMFFAYGIGNTVFFPFSVGATTILEPRRPTPQVVAERVSQGEPSLFFGVPTFYAALVASDITDDTFASVRLAASAGEPLPAPLQEKFTRRFGVEILDGIGSTEALHIFLSNRPDDIRPGTTGQAVPGYDVEIRDESGAVAEAGEPGALYVRGQSIALGYWHRTDATRQVFQGEWLSTGDTYIRDEQGYYRCLGRNTDMLKAGGIWVSPSEVESRLLEHASVRQAAVVGVPDADGLDKPVAAVVIEGGTTPEELIAWCREGLAHFKAPRRVIVVDDLPKTATGKLQRYLVRDLMVDGREDAEPPTTTAAEAADVAGAPS